LIDTKEIVEVIDDLKKKKFTGKLTLIIVFNEGGIRDVEKMINQKIK